MERPAVLQRYAAPDFAVCHLGHRPVSHCLDAPHARIALFLSIATSRRDGHLHVVVSPVREVLPHFPAPGPDGYRFLQARWGGRWLCAVRSLRTTVRLAIAGWRLEDCTGGSRHSV